MGDPKTSLVFHPRLKTFARQFLDKRRRKEGRDNRKTFIDPELIDARPDGRKRLEAFRDNRSDVECFELARHSNLPSGSNACSSMSPCLSPKAWRWPRTRPRCEPSTSRPGRFCSRLPVGFVAKRKALRSEMHPADSTSGAPPKYREIVECRS